MTCGIYELKKQDDTQSKIDGYERILLKKEMPIIKDRMERDYEIYKLKRIISELEDENEELKNKVEFWKNSCKYWRNFNG